MSPDDLAALHTRAMTHAAPWSAAAFAGMLAAPGVFLLISPSSLSKYPGGGPEGRGQSPRSAGFALGRAVAGEAELLTLAVAPTVRRRGLGRDLLARFEAEAGVRGAAAAFLEVAADNRPAAALYRGAGWSETGRRPGYYARAGARPVDALILRKTLKAL